MPIRRLQYIVFASAFALIAQVALAVPVAASGARPMIWPTTGRITQPFGCTGFVMEPHYGSCRHFHKGIDIANSRGTPIWAPADGTIAIIGWDPWLSHNPDWIVVLNHADGLRTIYGHLKPEHIGLHKGDRVTQGQVIGHMSDTGMATGVHLHWGVFLNHRPVDPRDYVRDTLSRGTRNNSSDEGASGNCLAVGSRATACAGGSSGVGGSAGSHRLMM